MTNEETVKRSDRLTSSIICLEKLKEFLIKHPELRLEQVLWNLDQGMDKFYEEPWDTEKRWENAFKIMES